MVAVLGLCLANPAVYAAKGKPNILVIWGDDIGIENISYIQSRHDGLYDAQH